MPFQRPDTRIITSGGGGGGNGGGGILSGAFQTLGQIQALRGSRDLQEQRKLEIEKRQRDLEDDDAIRTTMQQVEKPEDAYSTLMQQGRVSAAGKIGTQIAAHRKSMFEAYNAQLDVTGKRMKQAGQILQGVHDDNSLKVAIPALGAVLEPVFGKGIYDQIGTTYDPERIKKLLAWGTERGDFLKQQQDAIANADKATDLYFKKADDYRAFEKNRRESETHWMQAGANLLSTARNPEQWDQFRIMLGKGGMPAEYVARFQDWDDDAPARARQLGMTPAQAANAETAATRAENAGGGGGGAGRRLTPNRLSEVDEKQKTEFAELEKELRKLYRNPKAKTDKFAISIPPEASEGVYKRKLEIHNRWRVGRGLATLEEAIAAAQESGDDEALAELQKKDESLKYHGHPPDKPPEEKPKPKTLADIQRRIVEVADARKNPDLTPEQVEALDKELKELRAMATNPKLR
jgi:hypothetical protein